MAVTREQAHREMAAGMPPTRYRSLDEIDRAIGDDYHRQAHAGLVLPRPTPNDMVVMPKHYARFQIEPYHFCASNKFNAFQFNIVKYAARAEFKHKEPYEDLLKVVRNTMMYGKFLSGDPDWWKDYKYPGLASIIEQEMTNYAREHTRGAGTQAPAGRAGNGTGETVAPVLPATG